VGLWATETNLHGGYLPLTEANGEKSTVSSRDCNGRQQVK